MYSQYHHRGHRQAPFCPMSVADEMSGFGSRRSVRFLEEIQTGGSGCNPRDGWRGMWRGWSGIGEGHLGGRLSCIEAAELLGISERHFRRLRDPYEAEGAEGLIDRRRGRASGRRAPVDRIEFVVEQYRTRYWDFTVKHFHEALQTEHGFSLGDTWTKTVVQSRGLVAIAPHRSAHRKKRPRRPLPGMMLFQDGSTHEWLAGRAAHDLIVPLDSGVR